MVVFAALYITVLALWVVMWQKRESQFVREALVREFRKRQQKNNSDPSIAEGGVVFVLKNMESEVGRGARLLFRRTRAAELAIVGVLVVGVPVAIAIHAEDPQPAMEATSSGW